MAPNDPPSRFSPPSRPTDDGIGAARSGSTAGETSRAGQPPTPIRTQGEAPEDAPTRLPVGRTQRLRYAIARELRSRPFGYVVFAIFVIAGPFAVHLLFPEAPTLVGLLGGICFGAYAALCAVPQKFL